MKTRRSSREETHLRILAKANELFRQYGFGKTTVADIAEELGMSPANIYKFFPSKNAIVEACAEGNVATIKRNLTEVLESGGGSMDRIERCVLSVFHFHKELFQNERQIFKLVASAIEEGWPCVQEYNQFMLDTFTRLVGEGIRSGEFRSAEPRETARSLLDCLSLTLHPHLEKGSQHDGSEERVRTQIEFLGKALR